MYSIVIANVNAKMDVYLRFSAKTTACLLTIGVYQLSKLSLKMFPDITGSGR